jgi:hypothetical protein
MGELSEEVAILAGVEFTGDGVIDEEAPWLDVMGTVMSADQARAFARDVLTATGVAG